MLDTSIKHKIPKGAFYRTLVIVLLTFGYSVSRQPVNHTQCCLQPH